MNIKELKEKCEKAIADGHGDKEIWLSNDDEGNGFHKLFYSFTPDVEANDVYDQGLNNDQHIILG